MSEIAVRTTSSSSTQLAALGVPAQTVERLRALGEVVANGTPEQVVDALLYADALSHIAREKRAASVAREAARVRILAARRIGELLAQATTTQADAIWEIIPGRFGRVDDLGRIPLRIFRKVTAALIDDDCACTVAAVVRKAKLASLKQVEPGIYIDYDGGHWITNGSPKSASRSYAGPTIEQARERLSIRAHPHAATLESAYSSARNASLGLSTLCGRLTGEPRKLVGEAELAQMRVAELLDEALRSLTGEAP